eukprot:10351283-Alexandrium_andersonii.AAC.1
MSASLVGSEMCIRDRFVPWPLRSRGHSNHPSRGGGAMAGSGARASTSHAVSYTHLTLPTICSV